MKALKIQIAITYVGFSIFLALIHFGYLKL